MAYTSLSMPLHGKCEDCIIGQQTRRPFDGMTKRNLEVLELVSFDLWGLVNDRGMETPAGKWQGYARVWVWVSILVPASFKTSPRTCKTYEH